MKPIDVSALKEWIESWFAMNRYYHPYAKNNSIPINELYDILEQMPSAQPERNMGEWEHLWDAPDGTYKGRCAKCGFVHVFIDGHNAQYNYCPHCGARMEDRHE